MAIGIKLKHNTGEITTGTGNLQLGAAGNLILDYATFPSADGTNTHVLSTDGAGNLSWVAQSGGSVTLSGLTDTNITTPAANALLQYDGANWIDAVPTTAHITEGANLYYTDARADARIGLANLSDLVDVHTAGPTDGQVLKWVNSNSRWEPATDSGGIALTDLSVTTASVGTAALAYNNGSGVFTYTPPNLSSYLTSETSHADVVVDGDFASQGIMLRGGSAGVYSILTDASANWNTAFGWGDHASGGYLTSIAANSINDTHIDWGTGANQVSTADIPEATNLYYTDARADARADLRVDAGFAAKSTTNLSEGTNLYYTDVRADARITNAGSANWNTAYGWGDHASGGYLTSETFTSVVQDTTPQLGGDLDGNSKAVTNVKRLEIVDSAHTGSSLDISNGAVAGGVQKTYVLSGSTTNNTQTEIFVGAQASTRMDITSGNVWMFDVDIIAINSGNNEQAGWKYSGMIHNFGGTTSLTSNLGEVEVDPQTNWSVDVSADNAVDALVIKVTGENSKTLKWVAFVKTTQLS